MKMTLFGSIALAAAMPMTFAAEPEKDKSLLQKTGDSLESGAKKTGETMKKVGDKAVDLVTTSEEEKKQDAKADASKKSADQKAEQMKNDAKADALKKSADDKAEHAKSDGQKK